MPNKPETHMGKKNAHPESKSVIKKQAAAAGEHEQAPLDFRALLNPRQVMPGRTSC
jgi:hypothetical protein